LLKTAQAMRTSLLAKATTTTFWCVRPNSCAKAKGRKLGRPRVAVDAAQVARLRASGFSWPKIAHELGVSVGTAYAVGRAL